MDIELLYFEDCPNWEMTDRHLRKLAPSVSAAVRHRLVRTPEEAETDPQNDFLSEDGATWELVGESVTENRTIEHLDQLLGAARSAGMPVFVSPHHYYPTDDQWQFGGTLEEKMHEIDMFDRAGPLSLDGFAGSGADWLPALKPHLEQGFEVAVVKDATAAAKHPELGDGYAAALTNFAYIASAVLETAAVVSELRS